MPAVQELYYLYEFKSHKLSQAENTLLEIELFMRICENLEAIYQENIKNFLELHNLTYDKENTMFSENLIRDVINDIISTNEYTLNGIAYYSDTPEEVIHEIMLGRITSPSLSIARKIIEIHRSVRPNLYRQIIAKIIHESSQITEQVNSTSRDRTRRTL